MKVGLSVTCFLAAAVALGTLGQTAAQESPQQQRDERIEQVEARTLAALTRDARVALRAEATLEARESWELAVRTLVALNDELRNHPKNREGSSFAKLKRTVRRRLVKAQEKLKRAEGRSGEDAGVVQPAGEDVAQAENPGGEALEAREEARVGDVLAQQAGGLPPRGGGVGGGPGGAGFAAGGGLPGDYGDTLVDLIERTINADIWDSAGGPAVIMYYQPNQALIITAPADVHDNVSELLRQLRATASP